MPRLFTVPFASGGDKVVVPDAPQPDGSVSYSEGYTLDYELENTDPDYKPVPRDGMNGLFFDLTDAVGAIQAKGLTAWSNLINYTTPAIVFGSNGLPYIATQASGPGTTPRDPISEPAYWQIFGNSVPVGAKDTSISIAAASATATVTAEEIVLGVSLSGQRYKAVSVSAVINLATTGAGGMDTGAAPANGWVALYAIYNPTTNTVAMLATNATAAKQPEIYGGANMPAGYTASSLLSVLRTTAGGLFDVAFQTGRYIAHQDRTAIYSGVIKTSLTAVVISGNVPWNAKSVNTRMNISSSSGGVTLIASAAGSATGIGAQSAGTTNSGGGAGFGVPLPNIPIITPQTIFYTASVGAGAMDFFLITTGYTI